MTAALPLVCLYRDGAFHPRSRSQADKYYGEGEVVALERFEHRSINSHNHEFAALASAWENLPAEMYADEFTLAEAVGRVLTRFIAMSQSMRAMGKVEFQKSKQAILELAAAKIGITPEQLKESESP